MTASDQPLVIVIDRERPLSWNKAYSGQHWTARKAEADRVHQLVRAYINPDTVQPFTVPVDIDVHVFFANRPLDADNIPAKLYVDALKGLCLVDDDRRFVRSVRTVTDVDKRHPRVTIEITPATHLGMIRDKIEDVLT